MRLKLKIRGFELAIKIPTFLIVCFFSMLLH
jgi:hypothetical protein